MEKVLSGKRILFFSPAFFGYENRIADKMIEMGAYVDYYDVRSVTSAMARALLKVSPNFFRKKTKKYYEEIISENRDKEYDYILIVKCDMTSTNILEMLKNTFSNAKMCLYLWDSVENIPGVAAKFRYFDTLHSFDYMDCKKYEELKLRPLFYADQFRKQVKRQDFKYDLSFLGTIHSDRFRIINEVQREAQSRGMSCYWFLYLQSRFIYYFYKLTKKEFRHASQNIFSFDKRSAEEIADVVEDSKVILDIESPKQTGLTMRTIEMIGMNKKLLTTNTTITNYDFYSPNNISIIDRKKVQIDRNFFNTSYEELDAGTYEKYSIGAWILEVLDI